MVINSTILFYLLEKKWPDSLNEKNGGCTLSSAKMFRGACPDSECLYIVDNRAQELALTAFEGCAFLVFGLERRENIPVPGSNDVFYLFQDIDGFEVMETAYSVFRQLSTWDSELTSLSSQNMDFSKLFFAGESMLERPYLLIDRSFSVTYCSPYYAKILERADDYTLKNAVYKLPGKISAGILSAPDIDDFFKRTGLFLYPQQSDEQQYLCRNILNNGQFFACLVIPLDPGESWPPSGFTQLFQYFSDHIAKTYVRYAGDTFLAQQNNPLHRLLKTMIFSSNAPLPHGFLDILNANHWEPDHNFLVVKLQFFRGIQLGLSSQHICQQLERTWPNSCALESEDSIAWVIDLTLSRSQLEKQDFHQALAYFVREHICKAGVSTNFSDIYDIHSYYVQADYALSIGQEYDPYLWYFRFENYITKYLCKKVSEDFPSNLVAHKGVMKLYEYDLKNDTEYAKTLMYYYKYGQNMSRAADAMFVHRTTFIRRMDKIQSISGINPNATDDLLHILFTLELFKIK